MKECKTVLIAKIFKKGIFTFLIVSITTFNFAFAVNTYATWNPSDKSTNIALSGGNLVATTSVAGAWSSVRSTIGVSSGKWYWEYTITTLGISQLNGIGKSTAALENYPGSDANGWGYLNNGKKFTNGSGSAYGASFTTGDVIGVALDMDGGTVTMYKNNVSQGTMFTGLSGTMYAMPGLIGVTSKITANFGATTMTYSAPSGYNQGLYTTSGSSVPPTLGFFRYYKSH